MQVAFIVWANSKTNRHLGITFILYYTKDELKYNAEYFVCLRNRIGSDRHLPIYGIMYFLLLFISKIKSHINKMARRQKNFNPLFFITDYKMISDGIFSSSCAECLMMPSMIQRLCAIGWVGIYWKIFIVNRLWHDFESAKWLKAMYPAMLQYWGWDQYWDLRLYPIWVSLML